MSTGNFKYYTKTLYEYEYKRFYDDFYDRVTVKRRKNVEERNAEVIEYTSRYGDEFMRIRYTLSEANRTVIVDEVYAVNSSRLPSSETVPRTIRIFGVDNGVCYYVAMHGLTERPSEEWLLSFGMEPFREWLSHKS